jgi:ubiquinone/menaquinone biosynthesis C-methylase UbiE
MSQRPAPQATEQFRIYDADADLYERLVTREDHRHHLLPAIRSVHPLTNAQIVEWGAGTGRLTRLVAPHAHTVLAFDRSAHMLEIARSTCLRAGHSNIRFAIADHTQIPLASRSADLALEGWSFGHYMDVDPQGWGAAVDRALAEMERIVRPGGTMLLIETLGTNQETPHAPTTALAEFYGYLEGVLGFEHRWIRTDYEFPSLEEAEQVMTAFFGPDMGGAVRREQKRIIPECTGLWWSRA